MDTGGAGKVSLGPYTVELDARRILRGDNEIRLHWRSFEVLRALVEANGNTVTRDRLIDLLWSGAIVEESNLHKYVSILKKALSEGDSGREYVETVLRIGYRLVLAVRSVKEPSAPTEPAPPPAPTPSARRFAIPALVMLALVGLLVVAGFRRVNDHARFDEAEEAYRSGMQLLRQRTFLEMRRGTGELRKAVELRPGFAKAWAGLAEAAVVGGNRNPGAAMEFAERAVGLDPACGECQATIGFAQFVMQWKWRQAGSSLQRGLALKPQDPQIQYWYAQREIIVGNSAGALAVIDNGLRQNPQALNLYNLKAAALYFGRDYAGAVEAADKAIAAGLMVGWHWRSKAKFLLANYDDAVRALIYDWGASSARSQEAVAQRADTFGVRYQSEGLDAVLRDLIEFTSGKDMSIQAESRARFYMLLRQPDQAIQSLETAVEACVFDVIYIGVDPIFDPIRGRPEFQKLLERVGLKPSGKE